MKTARSASGAHTLPGKYYTSQEIYDLESERIFSQRWICVGLVASLSSPGSYFLAEIEGESIIIVKEAIAVSDNGNAIVGWGRNPDGNIEAWIAMFEPPPPCPADLNGDRIVDVLDLLQVVHALRTRGDVEEDLDGDGMVTPLDVQIVIENFGPCKGS